MPWIFYLFIACILVSMGGVIATIVMVISINKKKKLIANNKEQVYVKNTYKTIDKNLNKPKYFVEFVARDGSIVPLEVKQDLYEELYVNDMGSLARYRNKILFFEKKKTTMPTFFKETKSTARTVQVVVESPRFNLKIAKKDGIYATLGETLAYLARMMENKKAHFLSLEDESGDCLEISGNELGKIDLRFQKNEDTYVVDNVLHSEIETIVKKFYAKTDLTETYQFQPEEK